MRIKNGVMMKVFERVFTIHIRSETFIKRLIMTIADHIYPRMGLWEGRLRRYMYSSTVQWLSDRVDYVETCTNLSSKGFIIG